MFAIDPLFMDHEFQVEEPNGDFDSANANEMEFEDEAVEVVASDQAVVESTQVDLEALTNSYTGYGLMSRLLFIVDVCPPLRFDALNILIEYIMKNTQNVAMLSQAYQRLDRAKHTGATDGIEKIPPIDNNWISNTMAKAQAQLESGLTEVKRQKDDAVKESIRRALDDVFNQYVLMGNLTDALKLFNRGIREYCTAPNYLLQMLISWINVSVYANQWQKLALLLPQAERAIIEVIDRENIQSNGGGRSGNANNTAVANNAATPNNAAAANVAAAGKNYKELIRSSRAKITAVNGLSKMHNRSYKMAAELFMAVDIDALDYPQLLSASDVAVYGTLCALATFSRAELKERVLGSTLFRKFLESEPKLVELLQKFCRSEFGECLDILRELQDQALLNMFLAPHFPRLHTLIRKSSIMQYFHPYLSANIVHMSVVFRTKVDEMEHELIDLIEEGLLKARVDSYGKIIHAKFSDSRIDIYKRVMSLRKQLNERAYAILLRTALQNHKVGVGMSEKNVRRRRGNNSASAYDFMDVDVNTSFDGENGGSANVPTSSGSNRMLAPLQRLWNVVTTSRIQSSSGGSTAPGGSSGSTAPAFPGNGVTVGVADPSPTGQADGLDPSHMADSISPSSTNESMAAAALPQSSSAHVDKLPTASSSEMEMDDSIGDM